MPVIINGSTGISGTDGSAGTPAVQGTDVNTGMFFPAADQIAFAEGGVEAMRLDASGNVGIGTSSPGTGIANRVLAINGTDAGIHFLSSGADTNRIYSSSGEFRLQTATAIPLVFYTNNAERARISAGGDMMVGTTSANGRLTIAQTSGNSAINIQNASDPGRGASLVVTGTGGAGTVALNTTSGIYALTFGVDTVERGRFDTSGNFLVGTTNAGLGNNIGTTIEASGVNNARITVNHSNAGSQNNSNFMQFGYAGNLIGRIVQETTTTVLYVTSSDYRLKENVVPLTGAAARVQALKPCRFNFIETPGRTVDGFLAHEAAEVVPEAVAGEKDAVNEDGSINPQGIDQSRLVPLLTAALQEALTEIAALKARVAALEAR